MQILLGLPFLMSFPVAYISRAFNLGRVFIHFWSVNFKFVPEEIFVSKSFASALLALHLTLLLLFSHYKWSKYEGGLIRLVQSRLHDVVTKSSSIHQFLSSESKLKILSKEHITTVMFAGNFIGIVYARSLHYQFYSWYFFSLPFLLWKTPFPTPLRLILFFGVEFCWNVYPSNLYSSLLLLCIHLSILCGLWLAPSEYPYIDHKSSQRKEKWFGINKESLEHDFKLIAVYECREYNRWLGKGNEPSFHRQMQIEEFYTSLDFETGWSCMCKNFGLGSVF